MVDTLKKYRKNTLEEKLIIENACIETKIAKQEGKNCIDFKEEKSNINLSRQVENTHVFFY